MVQLGLKDDFGCQILEWDETVISMKDPGNFLGQPDLTKREMREVVMHTSEEYSTIEYTYIVVKIIYSAYAKVNFDNLSAAVVQLYKNQLKKLLSLIT